jgi:hypothetical protein
VNQCPDEICCLIRYVRQVQIEEGTDAPKGARKKKGSSTRGTCTNTGTCNRHLTSMLFSDRSIGLYKIEFEVYFPIRA